MDVPEEKIQFVPQSKGCIPIRPIEDDFLFGNNAVGDKPKKHGCLLPDSIRGLFVGSSGCGKTNAMCNLIYSSNGLAFQNLYIYSKSLYQPKYCQLEAVLSQIPEIGYFAYSDTEDIVNPQDAKEHSIFIFDDVACSPQSVIREYFSFSRHKNIDTFYLIQTYTSAPKQLLRDNLNFLLLFPQDRLNLKHVYDEHVNTDMKFDNFLTLCNKCWTARPYGCLLIDKTSSVKDGRYRLGFDEYIVW